jgi:hypothetical protein
MAQHYRCYILNDAQRIASAENVWCTTDEDAKREAADLLAANSQYRGIEIWNGTRRVHFQLAPPRAAGSANECHKLKLGGHKRLL